MLKINNLELLKLHNILVIMFRYLNNSYLLYHRMLIKIDRFIRELLNYKQLVKRCIHQIGITLENMMHEENIVLIDIYLLRYLYYSFHIVF